MSKQIKKIKYPYAEAYKIALGVLEQLKPFCDRVEIAGSIRRKKAEIHDIDLIAIPKPYEIGLFQSEIVNVINRWEKIMGELPCKFTRRLLPSGVFLDLFLVDEKSFGQIFAIRTGSKEFNRNVLIKACNQNGFKMVDGYLLKEGEKYEIREEEDLFRMIGLPFVPPENRNL